MASNYTENYGLCQWEAVGFQFQFTPLSSQRALQLRCTPGPGFST